MEKLYGCGYDNVIFKTREAAEKHAEYVYGKHNAFAQIREWYIEELNKAKREMTPLEKKRHKMKQRLQKIQEDFDD